MIHLDRASATALTDQIIQQLAGLIQSGQLPAGSRLPSIRKLAAQLSVSSATVVAAYDKLTARGLIVSRGFRLLRREPQRAQRASACLAFAPRQYRRHLADAAHARCAPRHAAGG